MKESEIWSLQGTWGLYLGVCRMSKGCEWVRIWKSGCVENEEFHKVQCNPQVMQSLKDCSVFFWVQGGRCGLVLFSLWHLALDEAEVDFGQSWRCVQKHHKRGRACVKMVLSLWGVSFPSLPNLEDRSGVVGFCSVVGPLFWVEPELVSSALNAKSLCQTCCLTC